MNGQIKSMWCNFSIFLKKSIKEGFRCQRDFNRNIKTANVRYVLVQRNSNLLI